MNRKPVIIAAAVVVLAACAFFFIQSRYLNKPQKNEVAQFLKNFDNSLTAGNVDSIQNMFETRLKPELLNRLLFILTNQSAYDGKAKPLFSLTRKIDDSKITIINTELVQVKIPIDFSDDKVGFKETFLKLKLSKLGAGQFKIVRLDAIQFMSDYLAFQNRVKKFNVPDDQIYSAETVAAFKTAKELKSKFDTVIWFQHVDKETYYYVINGKWRMGGLDSALQGIKTADWKMGLIGPNLNEIVPAEYDLIHNIGATFDGMVEVEKGSKRGFFNTSGKVIIPPEYDEILPIADNDNLAILRKDNDYYYLKKDSTLSDKIAEFNIATAVKKIKSFGDNFTIVGDKMKNVMEYNDRDYNTTIFIPSSYLVDWSILPLVINFPDPLRKTEDDMEDADASYAVKFTGHTESSNWFESAYYTIVNDYLGARGGLYNSKSMLVIDKKQNRIFGKGVRILYQNLREGGPMFSGKCNENSLTQLSDSLFQFKVTADVEAELPNSGFMTEAPYYHYFHIVNGKIKMLPNERYFSFTKYEKMNDSYLYGCYVVNGKSADHMTKEMLEFAKNEIFAEYQYKFKNPMWTRIFEHQFGRYDTANNTNVDDSLTAIDKYNINWIAQKLKGVKTPASTLAAK